MHRSDHFVSCYLVALRYNRDSLYLFIIRYLIIRYLYRHQWDTTAKLLGLTASATR